MSDKKHIDRVFQEKLKDFEAVPDSKVWENIQNTLSEQEDTTKKVFPVWLKYVGIAASLLLFITIGTLLLNPKEGTPIKVVDTENISPELINKEENNNTHQTSATDNNSAISNIETTILNDIDKSNTINSAEKSKENSAIVVNNKLNTNKSSNESFSIEETSSNKKATISSTKNEINSNANSGLVLNKQNTSDNPISNPVNNNASEKNMHPDFDASVALNEMKKNTGLNDNEDITEKEVEINKDSTSIEEAIAKAEDLIEKEEKVNRWQVYTNIAPVYYNTLGSGSHIHDQFVNNPKSGEINTSYGVNVGYAVNEKLTIRSGINSLNLSYDTDNVILYESVSNEPITNPLRNITFTASAANISVLSASNVGVQQIDGILGDNYNAAISQRISYYEVPLELEYRIINRNFGVNIIGGFSTFFLDGNEVYSEFEDRKIYIGEANNITSVSFSTNLGLGLNYKFTEKLKFNLEPTFKYQLNAFKETSGNFKPYIIGLYTGFSYKF